MAYESFTNKLIYVICVKHKKGMKLIFSKLRTDELADEHVRVFISNSGCNCEWKFK